MAGRRERVGGKECFRVADLDDWGEREGWGDGGGKIAALRPIGSSNVLRYN